MSEPSEGGEIMGPHTESDEDGVNYIVALFSSFESKVEGIGRPEDDGKN